MNRIPIVFAFDNNLVLPAAVCFFSLFRHAKGDTSYDVFILHHQDEVLNMQYIDQVMACFPCHQYQLRAVDDTFSSSFEIRGITTPAYYRLLIPQLIPEYDKVIYSDVDVIFRDDLSCIYQMDLGNHYFGGVHALAYLDADMQTYYQKLGLSPQQIIYSGNLLINSAKLREDTDIIQQFIELAHQNFKFQDMDIINLSCKGRIQFLPPSFCLTSYFSLYNIYRRNNLLQVWSEKDLDNAISNGIIHYNGRKPWQGYCVNFDIWWEYYRKSPVFDEKFYFDFYYNRLNELDQLPLWKRIKILIRYFVYGKRKNP